VPVDETVIKKENNEWVIKRHKDFIKLEKLAKPDEGAPEITIVPGIGKKDRVLMLPVEVRMKADVVDVDEVIEQGVPAVINKEHECKVCERALEQLKKGVTKTTVADEVLDALSKARPDIIGLIKSLL